MVGLKKTQKTHQQKEKWSWKGLESHWQIKKSNVQGLDLTVQQRHMVVSGGSASCKALGTCSPTKSKHDDKGSIAEEQSRSENLIYYRKGNTWRHVQGCGDGNGSRTPGLGSPAASEYSREGGEDTRQRMEQTGKLDLLEKVNAWRHMHVHQSKWESFWQRRNSPMAEGWSWWSGQWELTCQRTIWTWLGSGDFLTDLGFWWTQRKIRIFLTINVDFTSRRLLEVV